MATTPRHEVPSSTQAALHLVAERAIRYTQEIADRRVSPAASDVESCVYRHSGIFALHFHLHVLCVLSGYDSS